MRRRNMPVDSEEESDSDSDTSFQPSPKRRRGRPPSAKNKRKRLQDDSDDSEDEQTQPIASQNGTNNSQQDSDVDSESNSNTTVNTRNVARKKTTSPSKARRLMRAVNRLTLSNDSDSEDVPTQSTASQNGASNSQQDSDVDSESNSNTTVNTRNVARKKTTSPSKAKRPMRAVNRRTFSNDSDIGSPQPSTSAAADSNAEIYPESESGSETPDSDYGPLNERSQKAPKAQKKVGMKKKPGNSRSKLSNGSASKSASNAVTFDSKLVESLARKLVYFLLIEDQRKYAIKRKAIVASVFKDESYSPKLYLAVISKANHILKKTYGMELMELENQKDSYLIINVLKRELGIHDFVEISRLKQQQYGLILYILTVIFMNDNVITEDELTKSLKVLGVDLTSKKMHPVFGDAKKYITVELVKQMYLDYKRVSKEPLRYEFTWGLRAKQEFDKVDLLQFACEIMDDTIPEDWKIQYKDALECQAKL